TSLLLAAASNRVSQTASSPTDSKDPLRATCIPILARTRVEWSGGDQLQIATLAAVKSVLPRFDLLVALWRDGKPMLLSRVPVQIAILDCLAYLQKPRAIWRSWFCFSCFSHIK